MPEHWPLNTTADRSAISWVFSRLETIHQEEASLVCYMAEIIS